MAKVKSLYDLRSVAQYLNRIGAEPRSLRTAVIKEQFGRYWTDKATIHITKAGEVNAPLQFMPTDGELALIKAECSAAEWPTLQKLHHLPKLPDQLQKALQEDCVFIFRDENNMIVMLQQRIELPNDKAYLPWTYWDDDEWRQMEPEGKLPLYGLEKLGENTIAFIHEGAKAARSVQRMVEAASPDQAEKLAKHPWGAELSAGVHLGWIGGALSPARTDWSVLKQKGISRIYIVSDNDKEGVSAVPSIAYHSRLAAFHVQFTNEWPAAFDLADPFPKSMFKTVGKNTYYNGPSFRSCLHPATWATDQIPNKKGKPTTVLRDEFKSMWVYVEEADLFVCKDMPEVLRTEQVMNKMLASFSHVQNTSALMVRSYRGRSAKLCYRPDVEGRLVTDRTTSAINLHTPTHIKPAPGDVGPWEEFLKYLFPIEAERKMVERWCATLIAKPSVRMEYGLLLVSEMQGVGKTTLGARILAPLVGDHNVGFPTEEDIVNSPFNSWVANKRLIIIGEIYSGHSWKAYNKLKGYITDKDIEFNQKYMRPYRVENWVHILACSNSRKALKMEEQDRRWFYPQVTETPWPKVKFAALNEWLESGGLQIIYDWALNYGDYASAGERAPMTELKRSMIKESRTDAQQELADLCEAVVQDEAHVAMPMKEVSAWLKAKLSGRMYDSDHDLRKTAIETGFKVYGERIKIGSQMQHVLISPALFEKHRAVLESPETEAARALLRREAKHPSQLIQDDM